MPLGQGWKCEGNLISALNTFIWGKRGWGWGRATGEKNPEKEQSKGMIHASYLPTPFPSQAEILDRGHTFLEEALIKCVSYI